VEWGVYCENFVMIGLTADAGDNFKNQASIPLAPCVMLYRKLYNLLILSLPYSTYEYLAITDYTYWHGYREDQIKDHRIMMIKQLPQQ
jgi:hypothetical protein